MRGITHARLLHLVHLFAQPCEAGKCFGVASSLATPRHVIFNWNFLNARVGGRLLAGTQHAFDALVIHQ